MWPNFLVVVLSLVVRGIVVPGLRRRIYPDVCCRGIVPRCPKLRPWRLSPAFGRVSYPLPQLVWGHALG